MSPIKIILLLLLFFSSCTPQNDLYDFNICCNSFTIEEIQNRLKDIGEKYNCNIMLAPNTDINKLTEDFFTNIENHYKANRQKIQQINNSKIEDIFNDSIIDEIIVFAKPTTENTSHTGTITNNHTINYDVNVLSYTDYVDVLLTWNTTSTALSQCKVNFEIASYSSSLDQSNVKYEISNSSYTFTSLINLSAPSFTYSYTLKGIRKVKNNIGMEEEKLIYSSDYFGQYN